MKSFKLFSIIALVVVLCSACTEKKVNNYAIISGTLKNADDGNVKMSSMYTSISMDTIRAIQHDLKVNEAGAFVDTVYIAAERQFRFGINRTFAGFVIKPGQHVHISADLNDLHNTVVFSGDAANENNYLLKKESIFNRINSEYRSSLKDNEAAFVKYQDENEKEYLQLLSSTTGLSDEFVQFEKKEINYNKVRSYLGYISNYKFTHGENAPELSSDFMDVVNAADLQNYKEFQRSVQYQFILRAYYSYEFSKTIENGGSSDPLAQLQMIDKMVSNKNLKDELFIMNAKYSITQTSDLQAFYNFFMTKVSNKTYKDAITKQYNDLMSTQPGQMSPEFVDYKNINGGTNSLSDFRGKYVYIDVWATWCGPCKAEIPYLKEVEKKYHGKNIEFVSISVDKARDTNKWKEMVKEKELGGIQLIADKEFESEFVLKYQIKGIPQFILIDPEGKIVQSNAPRPSDEKLIELFNELGI